MVIAEASAPTKTRRSKASAADEFIPPAKPKMTVEGNEYTFDYPDRGIRVVLEEVDEQSRSPRCEIKVLDMSTGYPGLVHWSALLLNSSETRTRMANHLAKTHPLSSQTWQYIVQQTSYLCIAHFREGRPPVDLHDQALELMRNPRANRWAIEHILPEHDTTTVFADGGSLKSWSALACAYSMLLGIPLFDSFRPTRQGAVYYLDWETNETQIAERMALLAIGLGISEPPHMVYRAMHRPLWEVATRVRRDLERDKAALVIVDSLGSACGGDSEKADIILRTYDAIRSFEGVTRLVITHISKAAAEGSKKPTPFGSAYVRNASRMLWQLRPSVDAISTMPRVGWFFEKSNDGGYQQPFQVQWQFAPDHNGHTKSVRARRLDIDTMGQDDIARSLGAATRIRALLSRRGEMTLIDIAQALDIKEDTVRKSIRKMQDTEQTGERIKGNPGKWRLKAKAGTEEPEDPYEQRPVLREISDDDEALPDWATDE